MLHLQPFDEIVVHDRPALFLHYMTANRALSRIRFTDTEQRRTVLTSEIEAVERGTCLATLVFLADHDAGISA